MMCLHNKEARKQKPFAIGQGQTGNTMAEMKLKRNVLFPPPIPQRMQGVPVSNIGSLSIIGSDWFSLACLPGLAWG